MTSATLGLFGNERTEFGRWAISAAIVVAAHAGFVASYLLLRPPQMQGSPESPAVLIDLAPLSVGPVSEQDLAPGPEMEEAPTPPEPEVIEPPPPDTSVLATPIEPPKPPEVKPEPRKPPAPLTTAAPKSQRE